MTKSKQTKSALFSSVVALLLCFTMLLGTTFAWFTDNASSSVNKIQAGTLDIQLLDASGNSLEGKTLAWQKATGHESEEVLWEPGCTYNLQTITIKNNGNLALKYKIEITGIQGDAKLNEAIEWTITNSNNVSDLGADHSLEVGATDTLTISGHMKETAGNEYQDLSIDGIAITVLATQDTVEYDSNDNQYDADAEYAETIEVEGSDKAALLTAIENANPGDVVVLSENTTIAGYAATTKLVVDKAVVIDLNGKTLTTECGWGGIDLKNGASIVNGNINHTGNTAAIKVWNADKIENVTITVTETDDKVKGGIVVQEGADCSIGSIKNVTITGVTNGVECYNSSNAQVIGEMENVKINATQNGIWLNGAGQIGKIKNCEIEGGSHGIRADLKNVWNVSLDIESSSIEGGTYGIDIWDESAANTGSTVTLNYDSNTTFAGNKNNIKITLGEEVTCKVNNETLTTPCDYRQ